MCEYEGIIADGAIRSGKTMSMSLSFVLWAMNSFNGKVFTMSGKTIASFRRNVLLWLKIMLYSRGYAVEDKRSENLLIVRHGAVENQFFIFGGRDEASQDLIQGITSAGAFFDEVALMPESFVNQAVARCSVAGSKFWFNCNPGMPLHWFKIQWIDERVKKKMLYIHFTMDDNLSLTDEIKERYRQQFAGVFFKRYILGMWVAGDGQIYDMWSDGLLFDELPPAIRYRRYIAIDYGTTNPTVFLDIRDDGDALWVWREYYYDSKKVMRQKDDSEYAADLAAFIGDECVDAVILDPSAASFKVAANNRGIVVRDAKNDVLDGIRAVATMMTLKKLRVHRSCRMLYGEIYGYIWDEKAAERGEEKPVKQADHCVDALRYGVFTMSNRWRLKA